MTEFGGRCVVITGGAGGLGSATAEAFLKLDASVVLVDLPGAALEQRTEQLAQVGEVLAVGADVTNEDDVREYVRTAVDAFGTIDVFFNNAGIEAPPKLLVETGLEEFQKVVGVNLTGAFLGLKHVLPVMTRQRSGSVINTSSTVGLVGRARAGAYTATKHALVGLTKVAALEVAEHGVRVNSIHPTAIEGEMMRRIEQRAGVRAGEYGPGIPMGRYATPDEVARLVLFLASDDSRMITGAQYRVDGGEGALS